MCERKKCLKLQASKAGHRRERRNKDKDWPLLAGYSLSMKTDSKRIMKKNE
jgi:hypothetical protein